MEISVHMLGRPEILLDGQPVSLPFKQVEALLYYLLVEDEAAKFTIADMLWGDKYDGEKTKSNMRNAIYVLRKHFGKDFLIERSRDHIHINPEYKVSTDLDQYLSDIDTIPESSVTFLEDFYLKDAELYSEWTDMVRSRVKSTYIERLCKRIEQQFSAAAWAECANSCNQLINVDEFNEYGYRRLIEVYKEQKQYSMAIGVYSQLEKLLSEELFETPGEEIRNIVDEVRQERNREAAEILTRKKRLKGKDSSNIKVFYGRTQELAFLRGISDRFFAEAPTSSVVITGEAGIGKTRLADTVLSELENCDAVHICRTRCYRAEEIFMLRPWQNILSSLTQLPEHVVSEEEKSQFLSLVSVVFPHLKSKTLPADLDEITTVRLQNIENIIADALITLSKSVKLILCFDDVHWADDASLSLIRTILSLDCNKNILFFLIKREDHGGRIETIVGDLERSGLLQETSLNRFDYADTAYLAKLLLPDYRFTENMNQELYKETEGNPFFIIETLNNIRYSGSLSGITPNMRNIIKNRTESLQRDSRMLLELLSLFFDGASFDMLVELSNKEEYELAERLEDLADKCLIKEETSDTGIIFQFTHNKILEYVYSEMSLSKRIIMHKKLGYCYEKRLTNRPADILLYSKLIYHFKKGEVPRKYLEYTVKYVHSYLNTAHEYYPVVDSDDLFNSLNNEITIDFGGVDQTLNSITQMVEEEIQNHVDDESLEYLSDYYHMIGRYRIRKVEYKDGLRYIFRLKNLNKDRTSELHRTNLINANRQLMCIYINRYDIHRMRKVIDESFQILKESASRREDFAIWMRLRGLLHIMRGELPEGIENLQRAIAIFENSPERDRYLFNLGAAYAWLGEASRNKYDYTEALKYYEHAIGICGSEALASGVCTFHMYAGLAAFDSGDINAAKNYLEQAIYLYDKVDLMWGRGMAYCYYAQVFIHQGDYQRGKELLKQAHIFANCLESDYEKGVICRIYAQIRQKMDEDPELKDVFGSSLTLTAADYAKQARNLLKYVYSPIDYEYLNRIEQDI